MDDEAKAREEAGEASNATHLLHLPDDMLYAILFYCDLQSLGRLSRVCKRFAILVRQECVWIWMSRRMTIVHESQRNSPISRSRGGVRVKELCRRSVNWKRGHVPDKRLIHHTVKQLPWLQQDGPYMWISNKNVIRCYQHRHNGYLYEVPALNLPRHRVDVCRFVAKQGCLLSGARDGSMCCHSTDSGSLLWGIQCGHSSDVQAVDFHHNVAVSGSRDATVKIWDMACETAPESLQYTIPMDDRVWSLAVNPDGASFTTGTAGINYVPPLRVWNLQTGQLLGNLGARYKNGAGVLDLQYETPDILFSCGYDTYIRMWDLRCPTTKCANSWEEPFDSTIYCVRTDSRNVVMSGTARHGMVRLWDKRMTEPVQMYYTGKTSSPVYAMAFNTAHLYVALDKSINMLDFCARRVQKRVVTAAALGWRKPHCKTSGKEARE